LPLSIILRNRLKYALTRKESLMIVMQKLVKVDGKVRTELNFPAGFMGASTFRFEWQGFRKQRTCSFRA
jgi:small subunit ribosomal protein S4e